MTIACVGAKEGIAGATSTGGGIASCICLRGSNLSEGSITDLPCLEFKLPQGSLRDGSILHASDIIRVC